MQPNATRELARLVRPQRLFALINTCDLPVVPLYMMELDDSQAVSLYKGLPNEEDWAIGAYLVRVDPPLLRWITTALPRDSWGVLVESDRSLAELLAHFQQFVTVRSPEGEGRLFRFYDPRVLPVYLETASREEREPFGCGVVRVAIMMEHDRLGWLLTEAASPHLGGTS